MSYFESIRKDQKMKPDEVDKSMDEALSELFDNKWSVEGRKVLNSKGITILGGPSFDSALAESLVSDHNKALGYQVIPKELEELFDELEHFLKYYSEGTPYVKLKQRYEVYKRAFSLDNHPDAVADREYMRKREEEKESFKEQEKELDEQRELMKHFASTKTKPTPEEAAERLAKRAIENNKEKIKYLQGEFKTQRTELWGLQNTLNKTREEIELLRTENEELSNDQSDPKS